MSSPIYNFESIRFPQEVGSDEVPNYIRFEPTIVKYGGTSFKQDYGNAVGTPGRIKNRSSVLAGGTNNAIDVVSWGVERTRPGLDVSIMSGSNAIFDVLSQLAGFNITRSTSGTNRVVAARTTIGAVQVSKGINTAPDRLFTAGSINMFLPSGLATNSSVDYSNTELQATGYEAIKLADASTTRSDAVLGGPESLKQLFPAMIQDVARLDDRLRAAAAMSTGVVANNYSYQVFGGVQHRSFDYSFKLIPRSTADSATIKQICDLFLFYMLPAKSTNRGDFHLYEIPCQWNISYMRKGNKMEYFQQPYSCFLQSVNVSYGNDTGNSTFNDGAPMDVQLDLSFVEIEPMYRRSSTTGGGSR
ncbi:MAG: baseplate tail-tube junction protein [Candidatus Thiodiazotropha taylori]|uniref:Baseplate tail-tube junction protein n=1 Tax=Candidatus Thiodiazotropha taylori TaxID=2792791 RepID=A0A9E4K8K6_9GAMM|nr:baseplate tail-tube junction protein [Candidatus Thiodiazotropha taylori]MCW4254987.1 baseplate tail-tube junction protein [Candidatus Thiodiazotropha taylori]